MDGEAGKNMNQIVYEVETRVHFRTREEAFHMLPFLKDCLHREIHWETWMYGEELFRSGKLLRTSENTENNVTRSFIGYKEQDLGSICNIRKEWDEEITHGLNSSRILEIIGGANTCITSGNISDLLQSLGYEKFMFFSGVSLVGKDMERALSLKLMYCSALEYPLMLEIEKSAGSLDEAKKAEETLRIFLDEYGLLDRYVKKEPPTLLYEAVRK